MKKNIKDDIVSKNDDQSWLYSPSVREHFFNPKNIQTSDPKEGEFDGLGTVGSPVCGDVMKIWIKVDKNTSRIIELTWRTFGCASAIASTSVLSEMVTRDGGMKIEDAQKITARDILSELGGLPPQKVHCSVLGDEALREAIADYESR